MPRRKRGSKNTAPWPCDVCSLTGQPFYHDDHDKKVFGPPKLTPDQVYLLCYDNSDDEGNLESYFYRCLLVRDKKNRIKYSPDFLRYLKKLETNELKIEQMDRRKSTMVMKSVMERWVNYVRPRVTLLAKKFQNRKRMSPVFEQWMNDTMDPERKEIRDYAKKKAFEDFTGGDDYISFKFRFDNKKCNYTNVSQYKCKGTLSVKGVTGRIDKFKRHFYGGEWRLTAEWDWNDTDSGVEPLFYFMNQSGRRINFSDPSANHKIEQVVSVVNSWRIIFKQNGNIHISTISVDSIVVCDMLRDRINLNKVKNIIGFSIPQSRVFLNRHIPRYVFELNLLSEYCHQIKRTYIKDILETLSNVGSTPWWCDLPGHKKRLIMGWSNLIENQYGESGVCIVLGYSPVQKLKNALLYMTYAKFFEHFNISSDVTELILRRTSSCYYEEDHHHQSKNLIPEFLTSTHTVQGVALANKEYINQLKADDEKLQRKRSWIQTRIHSLSPEPESEPKSEPEPEPELFYKFKKDINKDTLVFNNIFNIY